MKKQNIARRLALLLIITATAAILAACKFGSASGFFNRGEKDVGHEEMVCYYGCPNSKRVKRLKVKSRFTAE